MRLCFANPASSLSQVLPTNTPMYFQRSQIRFAAILLGCVIIGFPLGETGYCDCAARSATCPQAAASETARQKSHTCCHVTNSQRSSSPQQRLSPQATPHNACQATTSLGRCGCCSDRGIFAIPVEFATSVKADLASVFTTEPLSNADGGYAQTASWKSPPDSHNRRQATLSVWRK